MTNQTLRCPRCGGDLTAHSVSYFNTEDICMTCKTEERDAPGFQAARQAEENAVLAGDLNFAGIGLSEADRKYLAERREQRSKSKEEETHE